MSTKRARVVVAGGRKRPITKVLQTVGFDAIAAAQQEQQIGANITGDGAGTVAGLRWDLTFFQDGGTTPAMVNWVIIHTRGITPATIAAPQAAAANISTAVADVMAFGTIVCDDQVNIVRVEGSTKAMRKFRRADRLYIVCFGIATQTAGLRGTIQYFYKE